MIKNLSALIKNMNVVRGSWAGQTFALSTTNETGGRKSRIRRSKEERKAMVESFIKRYQCSNKGSFPSLNLTHKEVGGSFYIVREIVREIIQENRILGPASFDSEEQNDDSISEQYPLGSISREPQDLFLQTEHNLKFDSNEQRRKSLDITLDGNGHHSNHQDLDSIQLCIEPQTDDPDEPASRELVTMDISVSSQQELENLELSLDRNEQHCDEKVMENSHLNNMQTNELREECDKLLIEESPVRESLEADGEVELQGASKVELTLPTEVVEVETFPLRPSITDHLLVTSTNMGNLNGTLNKLETKQVQGSSSSLVPDKNISRDSPSDMVTAKNALGFEIPMSEKDQHAEVNGMLLQSREVDTSSNGIEVPDSSMMKKENPKFINDHKDQIASHIDLTLKTAEQSMELGGLQPKATAKGTTYSEHSNATSSKNADHKEQMLNVQNADDSERDNKAKNRSSPTLDRINLESWANSKHENNPLLASLKAFVGAFFKFWSG